MPAHLIDGEFQSDKYPTTPRGKVPLSVKDPTAQDLLWEYAQRRRAVDAEFSDDLEQALLTAGYVNPSGPVLHPSDINLERDAYNSASLRALATQALDLSVPTGKRAAVICKPEAIIGVADRMDRLEAALRASESITRADALEEAARWVDEQSGGAIDDDHATLCTALAGSIRSLASPPSGSSPPVPGFRRRQVSPDDLGKAIRFEIEHEDGTILLWLGVEAEAHVASLNNACEYVNDTATDWDWPTALPFVGKAPGRASAVEAIVQIGQLAEFILAEIPGEPAESQGAVETAIRLLRAAYVGRVARVRLDLAQVTLTERPVPRPIHDLRRFIEWYGSFGVLEHLLFALNGAPAAHLPDTMVGEHLAARELLKQLSVLWEGSRKNGEG